MVMLQIFTTLAALVLFASNAALAAPQGDLFASVIIPVENFGVARDVEPLNE